MVLRAVVGGGGADREAGAVRPGGIETTSWGEQRVMINESCYESRYEPGSVLGEAHRFMSPVVICAPSSPAEPQGDLFEEIKPDYLR